VHLKADNRDELERHRRDDTSTRKRIAEVQALGAALQKTLQRAGEDQDVVVLGDFNHVLARERSREQADETKVPFDLQVRLLDGLPGFSRLAPAAPRPTIRWFAESIDHVVVSADLQHEAIEKSVAVHGPFAAREPTAAEVEAWQRDYSDHYPVTVDLRARADADPAATFAAVVPAHELRPGGWAAADPQSRAAAAAVAQAPPPRAASPAPRSESAPSLQVGQHVVVGLVTGQSYTGTLLSPLGEHWIHVDLDRGGTIAFPVRNVAYVSEK
jgi:hypothetical protein